ncbi:hypothetical protein M5K25_000792 [Dendrobium thyrsiflorum]|uniref:Uncharacterized protein n=1 Tax=Dendrobium thyrsiflorum TaxID=117978 RepID=A0ABD0VX44_DENTH
MQTTLNLPDAASNSHSVKLPFLMSMDNAVGFWIRNTSQDISISHLRVVEKGTIRLVYIAGNQEAGAGRTSSSSAGVRKINSDVFGGVQNTVMAVVLKLFDSVLSLDVFEIDLVKEREDGRFTSLEESAGVLILSQISSSPFLRKSEPPVQKYMSCLVDYKSNALKYFTVFIMTTMAIGGQRLEQQWRLDSDVKTQCPLDVSKNGGDVAQKGRVAHPSGPLGDHQPPSTSSITGYLPNDDGLRLLLPSGNLHPCMVRFPPLRPNEWKSEKRSKILARLGETKDTCGVELGIEEEVRRRDEGEEKLASFPRRRRREVKQARKLFQENPQRRKIHMASNLRIEEEVRRRDEGEEKLASFPRRRRREVEQARKLFQENPQVKKREEHEKRPQSWVTLALSLSSKEYDNKLLKKSATKRKTLLKQCAFKASLTPSGSRHNQSMSKQVVVPVELAAYELTSKGSDQECAHSWQV